eukprot:6207677-Pleurochrysis_carterae.AAC.1
MQAGNDESSSDDCAEMFAMAPAFAKPITAEEGKILAASDLEECVEFSYSDVSLAASCLQQRSQLPTITASAPAPPTASKRGKYTRQNGESIRTSWQEECKRHIEKVSNGSLVAVDVCTKDCSYGNHCLQNCFTQTMLKRCAARTFGECIFSGEPASTGNPETVKVWFQLVFGCRIVNAEGQVLNIHFKSNGIPSALMPFAQCMQSPKPHSMPSSAMSEPASMNGLRTPQPKPPRPQAIDLLFFTRPQLGG